MDKESIFRKYTLKNGESQLLSFGELNIRMKRQGQGWIIHSFKKDEKEPEGGDFYQTGISDSIILAPALQTKPLVFKGSELSVLAKQKIIFFLKIPLILQVYHTKKQAENLIKEITLTRLSDTWFGEPDNGEAAFALGADFKLSMNEVEVQAYEAICPVQVYNNWNNILELDRLILRVENMTIYSFAGNLVTSLVKVEYRGKDNISQAEYSTSKIYHSEKPQIVAKPRKDDTSSLKINFHFIRNIYKSM
jgi:hypothetical protein